jgi:hypothetical protein
MLKTMGSIAQDDFEYLVFLKTMAFAQFKEPKKDLR